MQRPDELVSHDRELDQRRAPHGVLGGLAAPRTKPRTVTSRSNRGNTATKLL
jgi:hypothetical protein